MLDLSQGPRDLSRIHHHFTDTSLKTDLHRQAFDAFDATRYSRKELMRGRRAWELRALDEYRSQVAFTEMLAEMTALRLPFDILGAAIRIVRDEARHVELCRRMVLVLGGDGKIQKSPDFVGANKKLSTRERILRCAMGSLCIGETISVRLLAAVRDEAQDELSRHVLHQLVKDESIHSQFGWRLFEYLVPSLSRKEHRTLQKLLPNYFKHVAKTVRASAGSNLLLNGPAMPFGSLCAERRQATFLRSMEHDVVPRFEKLGFDANRAWQACIRKQAHLATGE
jgi:hypothetical protein